MTIEILLTVSFVVIFIAMGFWAFYSILDDLFKENFKRKFTLDLEKALGGAQLSQKDLEILIDRWNLSRQQVRWVLTDVFRRGITGTDENLKTKLDVIRGFLESHYESEPIVGLPDNIQVFVKQLLEATPTHKEAIKQLASAVSEVVVKNRKSDRIQKQINFWSFVITTVSLIIGIASLYYSLNQPAPTPSIQQQGKR